MTALQERIIPLSDETELKNLELKVRDAFKSNGLLKGFTEVMNGIDFHLDLDIYVAGKLDPDFERAINGALLKVSNPAIARYELPGKCRRLVYDSISDITKRRAIKTPGKLNEGDTDTSTTPRRRYFNTRVFALIKEKS